ncbi:competence protein ComEA [Oikeobacillus pervagus]|uniref:Competence protein ComEA n=1 Tax=Oikeobacillus pervagus TaxID=1325931 RepID=A0AAJ1T7Y7_9BACI|nr:helix-hairpin-helix domain-containing protein [Oikeobacillus pervagus]MDQ0216801.1 competence protein ComEA [Oikeobacillus pervagus]
MKTFIEKYKMILGGGCLIFGFILFQYFQSTNIEGTNIQETSLSLEEPSMPPSPGREEQEEKNVPKLVMVDVKGAVVKPGMYQGSRDERVYDIIQKAGGFVEDADESKVNFAQKLQDEMIVYVPKVGEEIQGISSPATTTSPSMNGNSEQALININTATSDELQKLPGIGETRAQTIIEYRETNGPFQKIEDLKNISGIGEKTFEKLQDQISI